MNKLCAILCCIVLEATLAMPAASNNTEFVVHDSYQETSRSFFNEAAQTLGNYLAIFAIVYGSTIMHEFGHAIVDYSLTGNWPNIIIGEPDGPDHYNIIETTVFKLDISEDLSAKGKEFGIYPKAYSIYKKTLTKAKKQITKTLTETENADIEIAARINQFGTAASFMTSFAGPLSGMLSLLMLNAYLPEQMYVKLVWFISLCNEYLNLKPKPNLDGYQAFCCIGIKPTAVYVLLNIVAGLAALLNKETFLKTAQTFWNEFDIKDTIKYCALHYTIINNNYIERIKAVTIFATIIMLDYFKLIQQAAYSFRQNVPLLASTSHMLETTLHKFLPNGWHTPDIIAFTINWLAAIGIYGLAHGMRNFNPLVH